MSTKIDMGFRVYRTNMKLLLNLVRDFRPRVTADCKHRYLEFLRNEMDKEPIKDEAALNRAKTRFFDASVVGCDCNVTFFPGRNVTYGIFFGDDPQWFKHWLKLPGMMNLKAFQWQGKIWEQIMPSGIASLDGFNVQISHPQHLWRYASDVTCQVQALITDPDGIEHNTILSPESPSQNDT